MPISDHVDYPLDHFGRVYEYIIKPACIMAGFKPLRADDVKTTNYIALDIVKKIISADMAICDISSRNPNVLYEVGIRQAFNLPVTFIKDNSTERIFDISGFREVLYDESLRIDTIKKSVDEIAQMMTNTYDNKNEINSLVSLLGIDSAKVSNTTISADTNIILHTLQNIEYRISNLEKKDDGIKKTFSIPNDARLIGIDGLANLKVGHVIYAQAFGKGTIVRLEGDLPDIKVVVDFEVAGKKQLLAKFAKLYTFEF
jgi:hypothetical protein